LYRDQILREEPEKQRVDGDGITGVSCPTTGGGSVRFLGTPPRRLHAGAGSAKLYGANRYCLITGVQMPVLRVRRGDKVLGAFAASKIKKMLTEGKIKSSDLIQVEGDDQWNAIGGIPNLARLFAPDKPKTGNRQKSPGPESASSGAQKLFIKRADAVRGPLTLKNIQDGIAAGTIERSDHIGPRTTGPWKPCGSISKLFPTGKVVSDEFAELDLGGNEPDAHVNGLASLDDPQLSARPNQTRSFSGIFKKGAESIQRASKQARKAIDDVMAETQRAVDDKDRLTIDSSAIIGRSTDHADWVIPDQNTSRTHAQVKNKEGSLYAMDLKSRKGTYINGDRLPPNKNCPLEDGDVLQIGPASFTVDGTTLISNVRTEHAHVECHNLTRVVQTERGDALTILSDVTLNIPPKSFIVLLGPSGSGKSTLMNALNGRATATSGRVFLNKEDLYRNYHRLKNRIANVPQHDLLHFELPLLSSLYYTASLRLPHDMDRKEKRQAIDRSLAEVGMDHLKTESMTKYSGGQVKRASVAHELLSNPSLVCVDEATSGLDEHSDREIMGLLRKIADGGKTILCITHNLGNVVSYCDALVVMAEGGHLAYFGSPVDTIAYFGISDLSELYLRLKDRPGDEWAKLWNEHSIQQDDALRKVREKKTEAITISRESVSTLQDIGSMLRHGHVVLRRVKALAVRDYTSMIVMALQPTLVFIVIWMLFGRELSMSDNMQISFLLVISSFWFGCSNSAKEVVKERAIFEKERHAGLNAIGYLGAKAAWLICVTLVQSVVLLVLTQLATEVEIDLLPSVIAISAVALSGVALGLAISVLSTNTDVAVSAVPLAVIPQVVLGGGLKSLEGVAELVASIAVPVYWGYGAFMRVLFEDTSRETYIPDMWACESFYWSLGALFVFTAVLFVVSAVALRGVKVGRG
jgi:ABC-type multidrug transport system ATPase subunit